MSKKVDDNIYYLCIANLKENEIIVDFISKYKENEKKSVNTIFI